MLAVELSDKDTNLSTYWWQIYSELFKIVPTSVTKHDKMSTVWQFFMTKDVAPNVFAGPQRKPGYGYTCSGVGFKYGI